MGSDHPPADNLLVLLIIAAVLIILSLIFSASESAFLSINRLRVQFLRNQKNKRAVRTWRLLNNKEKLINTLLIGNNIVNISISAILTIVALDLFGNAGVGIATFVATLLLLVFGEITPKTVATRHPEKVAFFFSGFICVLEVILSPFVFLFTGFSRIVLKIFGIDTKKKDISFTEEEIKTFIEVGEEEGVIENGEKKMMHRVFKFTDLEAKDIMIPRTQIIFVSMQTSYSEILEKAQRYRLSRFPVCRKDIDDIVGILYVKDLLSYKNDSEEFSVATVMRKPLFILETKKMSSIQQMLRENKQSMAVVIDEYSGTSGILTSEDLESEIFGYFTDDYEEYNPEPELKISDLGNTEISGQLRLIDINEFLHINLQSEQCETIGGYISEILGHIPEEKESIIAEDYSFTVTKMAELRVDKVLIEAVKEEKE